MKVVSLTVGESNRENGCFLLGVCSSICLFICYFFPMHSFVQGSKQRR